MCTSILQAVSIIMSFSFSYVSPHPYSASTRQRISVSSTTAPSPPPPPPSSPACGCSWGRSWSWRCRGRRKNIPSDAGRRPILRIEGRIQHKCRIFRPAGNHFRELKEEYRVGDVFLGRQATNSENWFPAGPKICHLECILAIAAVVLMLAVAVITWRPENASSRRKRMGRLPPSAAASSAFLLE